MATCGSIGALAATPPVFRGYQPKTTKELLAWHAGGDPEAAVNPNLPIVDPHHHLFNTLSDPVYYRMEDLADDMKGGHRVLGTVYVEGYNAGWRADGPANYRSLGEAERIVRLTQKPLAMLWGASRVAAGIVSNVNLAAGDDVAPVLAAHKAASEGRLRGIRHLAAYDNGTVGNFYKHQPPQRLLADAEFRRGMARLQEAELSFDAWAYHTQLAEVADLAAAFPGVEIIVNHVGGLIGMAEHGMQREAAFKLWQQGLAQLARHPNVRVKVGGMGMTVFGFGFEDGVKPAHSDQLAHAWSPLVDVCLDNFGTRRCMFESNFPVDKQSTGYNAVWNAFKKLSASLSKDEQRDLFYRTACTAYRLPELLREGDAIPI